MSECRTRSRAPLPPAVVINTRNRSRAPSRYIAENRGAYFEITEGPLKGVRYVMALSCVTEKVGVRFVRDFGGEPLFGDPSKHPEWRVVGSRTTMHVFAATDSDAIARFNAINSTPEPVTSALLLAHVRHGLPMV